MRASMRRVWRAVRIVFAAGRYLVTMRAAFPRLLRLLLVIGAIQVPFSPVDEISAVIALTWLALRYRRTMRVAFAAARLDYTT